MPGVGLRGERSPSGCARQHGRQSGDAVRDGVRAVTEEAGRQRALLLRHGPPVRPGTRLTLATSRRGAASGLPGNQPSGLPPGPATLPSRQVLGKGDSLASQTLPSVPVTQMVPIGLPELGGEGTPEYQFLRARKYFFFFHKRNSDYSI